MHNILVKTENGNDFAQKPRKNVLSKVFETQKDKHDFQEDT